MWRLQRLQSRCGGLLDRQGRIAVRAGGDFYDQIAYFVMIRCRVCGDARSNRQFEGHDLTGLKRHDLVAHLQLKRGAGLVAETEFDLLVTMEVRMCGCMNAADSSKARGNRSKENGGKKGGTSNTNFHPVSPR